MEDLGRIVLRPGLVAGPVQGPGSKFWPGHRVLTGSPDRPSQFFFSNQNNIVLVKKQKKNKNQRVCNQVLIGFYRVVGSARSHRIFFFLVFSLTRPDFNPESTRSRINPPNRIGFQNYAWRPQIYCSPELRHYLYLYCISLSDVLYCCFTLLSIFKWKNIGTKTILHIILYYIILF
jgi:hypothetical protein